MENQSHTLWHRLLHSGRRCLNDGRCCLRHLSACRRARAGGRRWWRPRNDLGGRCCCVWCCRRRDRSPWSSGDYYRARGCRGCPCRSKGWGKLVTVPITAPIICIAVGNLGMPRSVWCPGSALCTKRRQCEESRNFRELSAVVPHDLSKLHVFTPYITSACSQRRQGI